MPNRNLNPHVMFQRMAANHQPLARFVAEDVSGFNAWKKETWNKVLACLGEFPETVDPNPELVCEWSEKGLRRQRWLIDVHEHLSASLLVNYPGTPRAEELPALLCWHGHGPFGKEPVMGNESSEELRSERDAQNYNYGEKMARFGYVTYAIDWIGAGERNPSRKPNKSPALDGRDWCNVLYLHATMFGSTSIAINVQHGKVATDFVSGLDEVDESRLGVMGLSGGGTMTLWSYLCDERFRAGEIICYSDLWEFFGIRDANYCGMQVAPGLYKLVDLPDLQGLLAPRPLLVDIGIHDTCFLVDTSMECFRQVEHVYDVAGASGHLELDLHNGGHGWGAQKSEAFFAKHLG
jgi:hypothetical protein